jgi:hypothetical protein
MSDLLQRTKESLRAVSLIEAAGRSSLTPIPVKRLHAFAYFADMLSPVWNLTPFDSVALKSDRAPFFARFQDQVDFLVLQGILEVEGFTYRREAAGSPLVLSASYSIRYGDENASQLIAFIREDDDLALNLDYLTSLATALSRLEGDAIEAAVFGDASWEDPTVPIGDVVEITKPVGLQADTATKAAVSLFDELKNKHIRLNPRSRLRLYAAYLVNRIEAA